MSKQAGFFGVEDRLAAISAGGDPLERLSAAVDFELFREELEDVLGRRKGAAGKGGRPANDPVAMFKILILQALYGLSDEAVEYQIRDRLSFSRFLGLGLEDTIPDHSTVWRFREALVKAGAIERLFARFDGELKRQGYFALGGQIIDASIVEAPKQRLTRDEKQTIKDGGKPPWPPAKAAHKDVEARWTVKRGQLKKRPGPTIGVVETLQQGLLIPAFGYKDHINIDRRHGFIRRYAVTHAAANDGRQLPDVLSKDAFASEVWADTAYRTANNEKTLADAGRKSMIHFRRKPGKDLTVQQARANAARSKVRSRVEHVFAELKDRMKLFVRTVGLGRAKAKIGLANLAYNMKRLIWLNNRSVPA
jgi:transposase, IS5 family